MMKLFPYRLTSITLISVLLTGLTPTVVRGLTFGEAVGIGAGAFVVNEAIQRGKRNSRGSSPEAEYSRGLEDGFNFARYDNPRNSRDYSEGFNTGVQRRKAGWRDPFRR